MTDWQVVRLEDAAEIVSGITLGRKTRATDLVAVPYLRVANVQDGHLDLREIKFVNATPAEIKDLSLKDGDLLLTEGGDLDKLGRGACWRTQIPLCIHQNHIFRVRLPKTSYDPDFVSFQIGSPYGKAYFLAHAKKTTGIASINRRVLGGFPLLTAPFSRQRELVERLKVQLAEVDKARHANTLQLKEVRQLELSVYRSVFKGVIPVALPKELGIPPQSWLWRKLTDLAQLESGHTPSRFHPEWWGGDVSWISLTEIRELDGRWVEQTRLRTNEAGIANSSARILPRGTVCFSRTASVGFVTIMAEPMATSQDFADWVCGDELDPQFLMYALICSRTSLRAIATGATHKTIYMPQLESFHICAPELREQKRIVTVLKNRLAEVERIRSAAAEQQREIDTLPAQILAEVFAN